MNGNEKLTKAQRKALQKQEWQVEAERAQKKAQLKSLGIWGGVAALVGIAILGLAMFVNSSPTATNNGSKSVPLTTDYDIELGDKNSKVTLIEYSDLQCPACASYHPMVKKLLEEYPNIHFIYRNFPLISVHKNAQIAAQAGYAANLQGKFWEMADLLFSNQPDWEKSPTPQAIFANYAQMLKMDTAKFNQDMTGSEAKNFVDNSYKQSISHSINSTPTFFINGKSIANPTSYDEFKKLIDDAFKK